MASFVVDGGTSADILSKYAAGFDGRPVFDKVQGKPFFQEIVELWRTYSLQLPDGGPEGKQIGLTGAGREVPPPGNIGSNSLVLVGQARMDRQHAKEIEKPTRKLGEAIESEPTRARV